MVNSYFLIGAYMGGYFGIHMEIPVGFAQTAAAQGNVYSTVVLQQVNLHLDLFGNFTGDLHRSPVKP